MLDEVIPGKTSALSFVDCILKQECIYLQKKEVELKENGRDIKVTNENKGEYIQYATKSISDLKIETQ